MKYKAILYDIDGTLLDTFDMNMYPLMQIIREELGQEWTLEQVRPFYAQPGLKTMEDLGIRDVETVYARWVAYVNAYEKGAVPYPGLPASARQWSPPKCTGNMKSTWAVTAWMFSWKPRFWQRTPRSTSRIRRLFWNVCPGWGWRRRT